MTPSSLLLLVWILLLHFFVVHYFGLQVKLFPLHRRFVSAGLRVLCCCGNDSTNKSRYQKVRISKSFMFNRLPDTAETVCPAVSVFNDTVFVFAGLGGAWHGVMMLLTTGCQTFTQRALNGKVAAGLWFEMPVVNFHVYDPHELNLPRQFLYLLLRKHKKVV